ncbi:MAG: thrombospondin type 3 repeat-containing protein [Prosthecobacter sp.]
MKTPFFLPSRLRRGCSRLGAMVALVSTALLLQSATAVAPTWWSSRGVFKEGTPVVDDYRALNQGQLKNLVRAAVEEMNATLPDGAGPDLNALLATWRTNATNGTSDDYTAVNVGQLKALGKLVRARLAEEGLTAPAMGTTTTSDDDDFALANVGQAKAMFAFPITNLLGGDDDDYDHDGLTNAQERLAGTDLENPDSDNDGTLDGQEWQEGTDPLSGSSSAALLVGLTFRSPLE